MQVPFDPTTLLLEFDHKVKTPPDDLKHCNVIIPPCLHIKGRTIQKLVLL